MKIPKLLGSKNKQRNQQSQPERRRRSKTPQIAPLERWHPRTRQFVDWAIIFGTVMLCLFLLPTRLPGMELLDIAPNWLLIWVVTWSVKRTAFQGLFAGVILGLLQDAMTSPNPSHAVSLGVVGLLTGLIQKQRFIQEDFISIALIVFGMAALAETIFASQLILMGDRAVVDIWLYHQKVALASAILSSLWAPVIYYPLNRWWEQLKLAES